MTIIIANPHSSLEAEGSIIACKDLLSNMIQGMCYAQLLDRMDPF